MKRRKISKSKISTIILVIALLIGVSLLLYPSFGDWWNSHYSTRAKSSYTEAVADLDTAKMDELWKAAQDYNSTLLTKADRYIMNEQEEKEYNSLLNIGGGGVMSYIDIPSIRVSLPIYHGVGDAELEVGVGHLPGSSLPVGGKGTHCVLSGHRGLVSAKLFTDLNKLTEGDVFVLHTLDQELTYEVDQIHIVLPDEMDDLEIDPEQDYCTLITCTPYGINTHRLLVRGHRIANLQGDGQTTADALQIDPVMVAPAVAAPILLAMLFALTRRGRSRKKNRKRRMRRAARRADRAVPPPADEDDSSPDNSSESPSESPPDQPMASGGRTGRRKGRRAGKRGH
jgi:sortase A